MRNPLAKKSWSPYLVGAGIGVLSWFAFLTADHPIGITTAFENTAALAGTAALPEIELRNEFYAARKREGKPPKIDWEWMLVVGVFLGAMASSMASGDRPKSTVPPLWRQRFGDRVSWRLLGAFAGGVLLMFGARLAQGCTSGHGISGALQLAVSSWLFVAVLFPSAILFAFLLFGREGRRHV